MRAVIMDLAFAFAVALVGCGLAYPDQTTEAMLEAADSVQALLRAVVP